MQEHTALDITCLPAPTLVRDARMLVGFRMIDWGLGGERYASLREDVCLTVAELVANACAATPETEIRIRLSPEFARGTLLLGVWDSTDEMPTVTPVVELTLETLDISEENFDRNGGWGIPLVMALASECGTDKTSPHGKWIWARFKT